MTAVTILAPVSGTVVDLADVLDPVFSSAMVGPGLAIEPILLATSEVKAAVTGTVEQIHPHAHIIQGPGGKAVLTHLGIDTVELAGEGFVVRVNRGDHVTGGESILSWSPQLIVDKGCSVVVPVIALGGEPNMLRRVALPGDVVSAGEELFSWQR